jgi:hypothetical protein
MAGLKNCQGNIPYLNSDTKTQLKILIPAVTLQAWLLEDLFFYE